MFPTVSTRCSVWPTGNRASRWQGRDHRSTSELDTQSLAELMVGSEVDAGYRAGLETADARPVVLSARDIRGRFLEGIDLDLRAGEVLGVAGLPGSGRDELPYALVGSLTGATGRIQLGGGEWVPVKKSASFDIPIVPLTAIGRRSFGNSE